VKNLLPPSCNNKKNDGRQQIFHFSLFTFTFFYYLCTRKNKKTTTLIMDDYPADSNKR